MCSREFKVLDVEIAREPLQDSVGGRRNAKVMRVINHQVAAGVPNAADRADPGRLIMLARRLLKKEGWAGSAAQRDLAASSRLKAIN